MLTVCPVCGNLECEWESWSECIGLVEEYVKCDKCGYYYSFAYGNYEEYINDKIFYWDYKSYRKSKWMQFLKKKEKEIRICKRNWKKYGKRCNGFGVSKGMECWKGWDGCSERDKYGRKRIYWI